LRKAEEYLAEFQHHDGITGTHDPKVEKMFSDHLSSAFHLAATSASESLRKLVGMNSVYPFLLSVFLFFSFYP